MTVFRVSVIIPLFNKRRFIRGTLESALAQSLAASEIIVVNDASSDGSVAVIADLIEGTSLGGAVRLIEQANAGPGPARNRGLAEATTEWVAFLDADDRWQPNHIATLAEVAASFPDADVIAARHQRIAATAALPAPDRSPLAARCIDFFREAQTSEIVQTSALAVRRAALTDLGGFGDFFPGEDFELWTRLALDHVIAVSPRATALYFQETGGLMEQHELRAGGFARQPIFDTLDRAIEDPRYAGKRRELEQYRNHLIRQNIRQAIYHCAPRDARRFAAELKRSGGGQLGWLALLMRLPLPLLRLGKVARDFFRNCTIRCSVN